MENTYQSITDFIFMDSNIEKSDVIFVPGSKNIKPAKEAADLFKEGYAPLIIPSGGKNKITNKNECKEYTKILLSENVPKEAIIKEKNALNTFENAIYSYEIIKKRKLNIKKAILVTKGYHSRRAYLTYKTILPKNIEIFVYAVYDQDAINKNTWQTKQKWVNFVMDELSKIGEYFRYEII